MMIGVIFFAMVALMAFLTFLLMELNWKTGDWKKPRYKGKMLPF